MALKFEVPEKFLLLQQQREPHDVIRPHLAEGNLVRIEPLRPHFWRKEKKKTKPLAESKTKKKLCEANLQTEVCEVPLPGCDSAKISLHPRLLAHILQIPLLVSDLCTSCATLCPLASCYWPQLHKASSSGLATTLHFNWVILRIEVICSLGLELPVQKNQNFSRLLCKNFKCCMHEHFQITELCVQQCCENPPSDSVGSPL